MRRRRARTAAWLAAFAFSPAVVIAQTAPPDRTMPPLPATAATVEMLVPQGWTIEQRHQADFNRDGQSDVLLLLRQVTAEAITPPRVLVAALATTKPRGYALSAANARLVPRDLSGLREDPMADGEITVRPGGFDLKLTLVSGAGSYEAATMRYRFRLDRRCFRLIGYDRTETHRATLATRDVSINFLTGAVVHTTGNAQSGGAEIRRERLRANPRRCLSDLGNGWTFDPLASAPSR